MVRRAFEFMRLYIHFSDNSSRSVRSASLNKPKYFKKEILKGLQKSWTAGKCVTIDESMIKYKGRAVPKMTMYMPLKPIKHGIKVFCVCCSLSAVMLGFLIY